MIRIFKLVVLLVISQVAFGQAPSNYTNINGRYRWIAGMFDSTFHIPKGSTPSLRTGGSTNSGGLFYNTSDSSVYTYTGTQWIKLRGSLNPSDTTNKYLTQVYKKSGSDSIFYVKGGTHTWAFNDSTGSPGGGGGGKIYYFNGGVNMGTFGGFTMYELGDTANTGAAANFTRSTTGNIANFITDPGKPGLLQIPAGVWSVDAWLSETGGGANHAEIWIEVEKWDGSTITTIATSPIEQITEGATPNLYSWSVSIPTTSLTVTDRIIIQFYISNTNGKTVTLYTQNGYVGEVHTTFTTGIGAINGLTAPAQYLVTGTSGVDFNISSATATHTFNLPTASSMIRGALSPTDWSAFNNKIGPSDTASMLSPYFRLAGIGLKNTGQTVYADTLLLSTRAWRQKGIDSVAALINSNVSGTTNYVAKFTGSNTIGNSQIIDNGTAVGIGTAASNAYKLSVAGIYRGVGVGDAARIELFDTQAGGATFFVNPQQSLGVTSLGTYGAYPISFVTNNSERMRLDASGNLALGSSNANSIRLNVLAASGYEDVAYFGTAGTNIMARINLLPTGTAVGAINSTANALAFQVAGSEKARLDASGNLGLGITPSAWTVFNPVLQVKTGSLASSGTANFRMFANTFYDGAYKYIGTGTATQYEQDGYHAWYTAPSGTAGNAISFTQAMTLDVDGNLNIGTTGGTRKLNVYSTSNGTYAQYISHQGTTSNSYGLLIDAGTNSSDGALRIRSKGGTDYLYVRGDGNVGIGSTSPSAKLVVSGTGDLNYIYNSGASTTDANFYIYSATRDILMVRNSGNIGIGTASPSAKLNVNGVSSGTSIRMDNTSSYSAFLAYINNTDFIGIDNLSGAMAMYAGSTERMRITSGGYLLLGTTTSAYGQAGRGTFEMNGTTDNILVQKVNNTLANYIFSDATRTEIYSTNFLQLSVNGGERLRVTTSGELLINTTNNSATSNVGSKFVSNGRLFQVSSYSDNTQESLSMYSTTAAAYRFYVGWGGTIYATSTSISGISDVSLKQNIRDLDKGLNAIMQLKPRRFDWINGDSNDNMGFIAQEVEAIFPELVTEYKYSETETKKSLKMGDLIPAMVKAIQDLKAEIETLKNK